MESNQTTFFSQHSNEIAEKILKKHSIITDAQGQFYQFDSRVWQPISNYQLMQLAMSNDLPSAKASRRKEIADYIRIKALKDPIPWNRISKTQVPVLNGVVDFITNKLEAHNEKYYLNKVLNIKYKPEEGCEMWLSVLNDLLGDDPEKIETLQLFFGYVLFPHAQFKKGLICYGPSNTGKSLVAKVLELLVGQSNVCSIQIGAMSDPRALAPIKNKMVNIISELPENALMAEGGFKQLVSTGDPVQIDPKNKPPETITPTCKHVIFTNTLPKIKDTTQAVYNRLLIIYFKNIIPESRQATDLICWLEEEIDGIFNWALQGAKHLQRNQGKFPQSQRAKNELQQYRDSQNPLTSWVTELLKPADASAFISNDALFQSYSSFPDSEKITKARFISLLKDAGYHTSRTRTVGKRRVGLHAYKLEK
ncbi:phage/plasmid primase, P4 family [Vampirovibrio sp.]|uniref:DNA primase family protein n=1 Tax=Vampirovibrio sp. TaxID=2717857 RepID=UPI0035930E95